MNIEVKRGDIWQLGNHLLMCGDAADEIDVLKLMNNEKAKLILTDPPYNVDYKGHKSKRKDIENDSLSEEDFKLFLEKSIINMINVSLKGTPFYVFMGMKSLNILNKIMNDNDMNRSTIIIWAKDTFVISWADYHNHYEPIWYGWKKGAPRLHPVKDRTQSNLWQIKRPKKNPLHPTQKPIELIKRIINNSSHKNDIILDLFGGSGTTLMACEELNRICRIMEISEAYCESVIKRYCDNFPDNIVHKL